MKAELTQAAPEVLDPLMRISDAQLQNPYPALNAMRDQAPVLFSREGNQWLVTGFDEASFILRSPKFGKRLDRWRHPKFLMRQALKVIRRGSARSMLLSDPPDHTRLRGLVASAFTPRVIHRLEAHIEEIADGLIDGMLAGPGRPVDLISGLAFPLPVTVIAELLGVPARDRDHFKSWSSKITLSLEGSVCPLRLVNTLLSMRELRAYLSRAIVEKRGKPEDDLISTLIEAQSEDNSRLSEEELLANTVLILIAGHETTVNLIGNGVYNLLENREQLELLLGDPELIDAAVEEILRFDPPVQIVRRMTVEDVEVGGQKLRKGDAITILIGACNRDPRVHREPDRFDIRREDKRHVTFGAGIHYCLGAELARVEARITFRKLLERMPGMVLSDAGGAVRYKGPFALRGLVELPVEPGSSG